MKYRQLIKKLKHVLKKLTSISILVLDLAIQVNLYCKSYIISLSYLLLIILGVLTSCYVNNIFSYEMICYIPYNIDIPPIGSLKPIYSVEFSFRNIKIPPITTIFQFHYLDLTIMQPYWDINLNNKELCEWIQKVYFVVNGKCIFLTDIHSLKIYYGLSTKEQLVYFQTWCNVYVIYNQYELILHPPT
jgi:hypothetical protein